MPAASDVCSASIVVDPDDAAQPTIGDAAASPATGSAGRHAKEQRSLVQQSLLLSETKAAAE